jgi:hypothetical protein
MADTAPKPFVFVLMPFHKDFQDVYELGIKAACELAGAHCERVDEQHFLGSMLDRVYNQIAKADIIVADMTGQNPNVFYEVGYAHALNKQVILATQKPDDIPFDVKHYPHIVYEGRIIFLKEQLVAKLRWCVENPKGRIEIASQHLELYIAGESLSNCPTIQMRGDWKVSLDIHNPTSRVFPLNSTRIGVIAPAEFCVKGNKANEKLLTYVVLPKNAGVLCQFPAFSIFPPSSWETLDFELWLIDEKTSVIKPLERLVFRVFGEVQAIDYPINIKMPP